MVILEKLIYLNQFKKCDYSKAHHLEGQIPFTRVCAKNFHYTGTWNFSEQYIHELPIVNFDSY